MFARSTFLHASRTLCVHRAYSTPSSVPVKLIAELRKRTEVSMSKAREALAASSNDVDAALTWLEKNLIETGANKAAKVAGRDASQGLISLSLLSTGVGALTGGAARAGLRGSLVELNCETDFVARNSLFSKLADDIAHTAAYLAEPSNSGGPLLTPMPVEMLLDAPLLSAEPENKSPAASTIKVAGAIQDGVARLGEKISLRRATTVASDPFPVSQSSTLGLRLATYVHNSVSCPTQGRIGALVILALKSPQLSHKLADNDFMSDLGRLERALARQVAGFETKSIQGSEETALYAQQFMFAEAEGQNVRESLSRWATSKGLVADAEEGGVEVLEFAKWSVAEPLE